MKRRNNLQIALELIILLGYLIVGVTALTYIFQHENITKTLLGLVLTSIGAINFAEFFTLKYVVRIKSIQSMIVSFIGIVFGILLVIFKFEADLICLMFPIYTLVFIVARGFTSVLNLLRQPLLNIVRIVLGITGIVFSIVFLVRGISFLSNYFTYFGIALVVESIVLLIEFLIHRYQN